MKPVILSPSQKRDLACPHRWHAVHVEKNRGDASYPLMVGSAAHAMAANYFEECKRQGKDHLGAAAAEDAAWKAMENSDGGGASPEAQIEALELFFTLTDRFRLNLDTLHGIEKELAVSAAPDGDLKSCGYWDKTAVLRGRLDLSEFDGETFRIIDWTTAWSMDKSEQLADYAILGAAEAPKAKRYVLETHFLRHGKSTQTVLGHAEIGDLWRSHLRIVRALQQRLAELEGGTAYDKAFPAKAGPLCSYCHLDCPLRDAERIDLGADPATVAAHYIALRSKVSRMEQILRGHVSVNGPLKGDSFELAYKLTEGSEYDAQAVLEFLRDVDARAIADLKVSVTKGSIEALIKRRPSLAEGLARFETPKPSTRWTVGSPTKGAADAD